MTSSGIRHPDCQSGIQTLSMSMPSVCRCPDIIWVVSLDILEQWTSHSYTPTIHHHTPEDQNYLRMQIPSRIPPHSGEIYLHQNQINVDVWQQLRKWRQQEEQYSTYHSHCHILHSSAALSSPWIFTSCLNLFESQWTWNPTYNVI